MFFQRPALDVQVLCQSAMLRLSQIPPNANTLKSEINTRWKDNVIIDQQI